MGFSEIRSQFYPNRQMVEATLEDPRVSLTTTDPKTKMTILAQPLQTNLRPRPGPDDSGDKPKSGNREVTMNRVQ